MSDENRKQKLAVQSKRDQILFWLKPGNSLKVSRAHLCQRSEMPEVSLVLSWPEGRYQEGSLVSFISIPQRSSLSWNLCCRNLKNLNPWNEQWTEQLNPLLTPGSSCSTGAPPSFFPSLDASWVSGTWVSQAKHYRLRKAPVLPKTPQYSHAIMTGATEDTAKRLEEGTVRSYCHGEVSVKWHSHVQP